MQIPAGLKSFRLLAILAALWTGAGAAEQTDSEWRAIRSIREARVAGDLPKALLYANAVIKQAPQLAGAYHERAQILFANGDKAGARQDIDRVIELQPEDRSARLLRAQWRLEAADYEGALVDVAVVGKSETALNVHGEALMALNRYREALEDFKYLRSGTFGPNTNSRFPYAVCLLALGQIDEAVKWFETDYNDGSRLESRRLLVLGLCMLGNHAEAEKNLADWIATAGKPAPADDYDRFAWESLRDSHDEAVYLSAALRFAQDDFTGTVAITDRIKPDGNLSDYARLLRHVALLRAKRPDDALKSGALKDPWAQTLARYLTGEIKADEVVRIAKEPVDRVQRRGRTCEACFYTAQLKLAAGNTGEARIFLGAAMDTGAVDYSEFALAVNELRKLNAAPKAGN